MRVDDCDMGDILERIVEMMYKDFQQKNLLLEDRCLEALHTEE